jgi:hypothetical protein
MGISMPEFLGIVAAVILLCFLVGYALGPAKPTQIDPQEDERKPPPPM